MSLKEAVANSLLMFVAATCVVLIVKAVSPAPPARQAMGSSDAGSIAASGGNNGAPAMRDGVKVYYLHGNTRCPTCRTIEAFAREAVQTGFAEELNSGRVAWEVVNYESPGNEHYATDYQVVAPNVVLVKFAGGKQAAWKGLPEVWEHVGEKSTFVNFVQNSLRQFLDNASAAQSSAAPPVSTTSESPQAPLPIPES